MLCYIPTWITEHMYTSTACNKPLSSIGKYTNAYSQQNIIINRFSLTPRPTETPLLIHPTNLFLHLCTCSQARALKSLPSRFLQRAPAALASVGKQLKFNNLCSPCCFSTCHDRPAACSYSRCPCPSASLIAVLAPPVNSPYQTKHRCNLESQFFYSGKYIV